MTKPAFNVGHYRHVSETPFQCFAGRLIIARLWGFLEHRSPRKNKTNKKQNYQSWAPSDSAHDVSSLVFGRIHTKIHIKILKLTLLLKFIYTRPRVMRRIFVAVANPIYESNSRTKSGWISFNGKGEDSKTDCDDARISFFSKSLTCLPLV